MFDRGLGRLLDRALGPLVEARVRAAVQEHLAAAPHVPPNDLLEHAMVYGDRAKLHIHPTAVVNNALFNLSSGEITLEEFCFFGHNVSVLTGTHDITLFDRERQVGVPKTGRDVVIGRGAWVSSNALVLGPCRIGKHAVVGAASVVTTDVPDYAVVVGTPAKVVKMIEPRAGEPAAAAPGSGRAAVVEPGSGEPGAGGQDAVEPRPAG